MRILSTSVNHEQTTLVSEARIIIDIEKYNSYTIHGGYPASGKKFVCLLFCCPLSLKGFLLSTVSLIWVFV